MIANPNSVVLTAYLAHWAEESPSRTQWLLACVRRHNTADWGDLDGHDITANDRALHAGDVRLLSRYPVPDALAEVGTSDDAVWIITDDLADPEAIDHRALAQRLLTTPPQR